MIYIFDLDGTLADISHRLHFIQSKPADWRSFYLACVDDKPISEVIAVCAALSSRFTAILIISGRSDEVRRETEEWLAKQGIHYDDLLMRRVGDHREDSVVKAELLDEFLRRTTLSDSDIAGVFEDRTQVVKMFRARGLRVFQVADGEF